MVIILTIDLVVNLRCQNVKGVKANFNNLYEGNTQCQFKCLNQEDSQEHMISYHELKRHLEPQHIESLRNVEYGDLFEIIQNNWELHRCLGFF